MMMSEFVERTGFQPTADEYDQIESAYYAFATLTTLSKMPLSMSFRTASPPLL